MTATDRVVLTLFFTVAVVVVVALSGVSAIIRPSATLYLIDGEGFVAYLEVPKSFGKVQNCSFQYRDDRRVEVPLNATAPIMTARGEAVLPFTASICGIRVNQLSTASAATWTLVAENEYGDIEEDHLAIHILPVQKTHFETHVQREIGTGSIECSRHDTYTKHCKLFGAEHTWNTCAISTTIRPNMTFECLTYNWGRMEESRERIIVDIKNSTDYTAASLEITPTNVVMRCQFVDALHSCQAEMPDRKNELYIMDGMYNGRYSSYDTQTAKSKCSLEIPMPLDKHDMGLWRIIHYDKSSQSGCLFYIGEPRKAIIERELVPLAKVRVMQVYQSEEKTDQTIPEMYCSVPFAIDDCYMRDPNGTVYFPEAIKFQRNRLYGRCSFSNLPVIAGLWACGARGRDYDKEVLQNIEVIVKSKRGEVVTDGLRAKRGMAVELMCKSAFEEPISHCVFIDPMSGVHLVATANSVKTGGRVQYAGRGLVTGDCGVKISTVNAEDFGQWRCQFIPSSGLDSMFSLQLTESGVAHATSVGLGIGLTVIILLVMGVVLGTVFYRKRHLTARHDFASADPLDVSTQERPATTQI